MKQICLIGIMMLGVSQTISAQYFTYNHDAMKKNQITIMEMGTGSFTPELYYTLFHNSYKKTASRKNKMSYRTLAGVSSYGQVDYAETIDSSLVKRADIEALNISDRSGGALDVAWMAEKDKLNEKMTSFHNNINRIVIAGGTPSDRARWDEYYKMFQCAIKATQDAYMPNSQRKKQYLRIYEDISAKNDILIRQLVQLSNADKARELLSATSTHRSVNIRSIAASAFGRWRNVGMSATSAN